MTSLTRAIFRPRSIALIGASADPTKHSALPQKFLAQHGYPGELFPINPRRAEVQGLRAYPAVVDVPVQVDHAFIMLPTEFVLAAVQDCVKAGVGCITIMSNGFGEAGAEGEARQAELMQILAGSNSRLLGPNALGVVDLHANVALSANEVLALPDLPKGDIGLISQSGSMMGAILSRGAARGIGFSKLVSVGNEADISVAELVQMMVDDSETAVIQLFVETIRNHEELRRVAMNAHRASKPILAYRLGRSAVGQQLAVSHTGALAGSGRATEAFLKDIGVAEIRNFDAFLDAPALFRRSRPTGSRIGAMSTTGGGGALIVDNLGERDIVVTSPPAAVRERLAARGITIGDAPLVDLTLAGTNAVTYGAVLEEFLASEEVDAVVAVVGSSSQFRPERAVAPIVASTSTKPVAVFLTPNALRSQELLRAAGIPVFTQPEACADALRAWTEWRAPRVLAQVRRDDVIALLQQHRPSDRSGITLNATQSQAIFKGLGIEQAHEWLLGPQPDSWLPDDVASIRYPCVLKIASADVPHKTEVGGVRLGIGSASELRAAAGEMLVKVKTALPNARIEGFQVQETIVGLAEVLVGVSRDPAAGPMISVGMGGVLAELYQDVSLRPAPVTQDEAHAMISEVKAFKQLTGYRNLPKGDINALAKAISLVSTLMCVDGPNVAEAEINPLVVLRDGQGVRALDGLVILEGGQ
ncbi:acetate--CoA ligase family protein [Lacisediminimonas profundi]|uniref:acetate--CoA ligase family protein n=1 Tax=Lacisediminimonas profundi TaxID=2603856 RepID=UPI00124BBBD0|nr:acetate--CoA ligase family protein [Lacisediminimonas profundi]